MRRLLEMGTGLVLRFPATVFVLIWLAAMALFSRGPEEDPRDKIDAHRYRSVPERVAERLSR